MIAGHKNLKFFLRVISLVLTLGIFYFAYQYLTGIIQKGELDSLVVRYDIMVVAAAIFFLSYFVFAFHWLRVGKTIDADASGHQLLAFFASQPYKYLPTSLFIFSFRAKYAAQAGMSIKKSSLSQMVENSNRIVAGVLVGILFYSLEKGTWLFLILFIFLGLIYILTPKFINLKFKKRQKKFKKSELVFNLFLASVAWMVMGVAFWLVGVSIGSETQILVFIAANALANVIGTLAFFAPGGIGIRELVFILFHISNPVIVAWRLVTFVGDMIFGFAAILLLKFLPKPSG